MLKDEIVLLIILIVEQGAERGDDYRVGIQLTGSLRQGAEHVTETIDQVDRYDVGMGKGIRMGEREERMDIRPVGTVDDDRRRMLESMEHQGIVHLLPGTLHSYECHGEEDGRQG